MKNVDTEHTGIKCAGTERNWTENADSERYSATRGPVQQYYLDQESRIKRTRDEQVEGLRVQRLFCAGTDRAGTAKITENPEFEQRKVKDSVYVRAGDSFF